MSAVQLLALERSEGAERVAVRFDIGGGLEVAAERRTLESWALLHRIAFHVAELDAIRDAIDRAIAIRKAAAP